LKEILGDACRLENRTVPWVSGADKLTLRACLIESDYPEYRSWDGVLAHTVDSAVQRAYQQSTLPDERRELLDNRGSFTLG